MNQICTTKCRKRVTLGSLCREATDVCVGWLQCSGRMCKDNGNYYICMHLMAVSSVLFILLICFIHLRWYICSFSADVNSELKSEWSHWRCKCWTVREKMSCKRYSTYSQVLGGAQYTCTAAMFTIHLCEWQQFPYWCFYSSLICKHMIKVRRATGRK